MTSRDSRRHTLEKLRAELARLEAVRAPKEAGVPLLARLRAIFERRSRGEAPPERELTAEQAAERARLAAILVRRGLNADGSARAREQPARGQLVPSLAGPDPKLGAAPARRLEALRQRMETAEREDKIAPYRGRHEGQRFEPPVV